MRFADLIYVAFTLFTFAATAPLDQKEDTDTTIAATTTATVTYSTVAFITTITFPPTFTPTPQASTFPRPQGYYQCIKGDFYHRTIDTSTPPIPLSNFISVACGAIAGRNDTILQPGEIRGATGEVTNFQIINHSSKPYRLSSYQCESLLDSLAFKCAANDSARHPTAGGCAYTIENPLQGCIFPYYGITFPGKEKRRISI